MRAGDRWLIAGTTGSGKTTFAKKLERTLAKLYPTSRMYILDSKMQGDFDEYPGIVRSEDGKAPPKPRSNQRYQVWQPVIEQPDQIEQWLYQVRHDPPALLLIDELLTLVYKRGSYSLEYSRIQKLGRALPLGVLTLTQELAQIPRNAIAQATHIARFQLVLPYEVQVANMLLKAKVAEPVDEHGFYYQRMSGRSAPNYFASVQEFLGN